MGSEIDLTFPERHEMDLMNMLGEDVKPYNYNDAYGIPTTKKMKVSKNHDWISNKIFTDKSI